MLGAIITIVKKDLSDGLKLVKILIVVGIVECLFLLPFCTKIKTVHKYSCVKETRGEKEAKGK